MAAIHLQVPSTELRQSTTQLPERGLRPRQHRQGLSPQTPGRQPGRAQAQAASGSSAGPRVRTSRAARDVLMVEPMRAKQMADEDFARRTVQQREQRFRDIEAINGAWAVLGVTAALVGEGVTGEGVLGQVALYLMHVSEVLEGLEQYL